MKDIINEIFGDTFEIKVKTNSLILEEKKAETPKAVYLEWTNNVGSLKFDVLIGLISNERIEKIVLPILEKYKINEKGYGVCNSTINKFVRLEEQEEIFINDLNSIKNHFEKIRNKIKDLLNPFFEKVTTIEGIHSYIKELNEEELSETLSNPVLIRKIVVNFLAGSIDDLELYCNNVEDEYREAEKLYPDIFMNHAQATKELYQVLKSL